MKVHLIRHGSTATSGLTYAGRSDVALSRQGRDMARDLAVLLSRRPVAAVVSSPLQRARATGEPLANALGLPLEVDPRLMEFDFGAFEGRPKREMRLKLRRAHARTPVPGGEALSDVWTRAGAFLDDLAGRPLPADAEVAVIGHFWVNRMIRGLVARLDFDAACRSREYRPATGSAIQLDL